MTRNSAQNSSKSLVVLTNNTATGGEASTIWIRADVLTGCSVHVWLINRQTGCPQKCANLRHLLVVPEL